MSYFKIIFSPLVADTAAVPAPPVTINYLTVRVIIITIRLCFDTKTGWTIRCVAYFVLENPVAQELAKLSNIMCALYWGISWHRDRLSSQIHVLLAFPQLLFKSWVTQAPFTPQYCRYFITLLKVILPFIVWDHGLSYWRKRRGT